LYPKNRKKRRKRMNFSDELLKMPVGKGRKETTISLGTLKTGRWGKSGGRDQRRKEGPFRYINSKAETGVPSDIRRKKKSH